MRLLFAMMIEVPCRCAFAVV